MIDRGSKVVSYSTPLVVRAQTGDELVLNTSEALEAYDPFGHWELSDHMGDVKWRLGEQEEARKHWRAALRTATLCA